MRRYKKMYFWTILAVEFKGSDTTYLRYDQILRSLARIQLITVVEKVKKCTFMCSIGSYDITVLTYAKVAKPFKK